MAAKTYNVVCAVYDGPRNSDFVPMVRNTDEDSNDFGNPAPIGSQVEQTEGTQYGYWRPTWKFLDQYYSFTPRVLIAEATEFTATPTIDGTGGSWVLRWRYDPENPSDNHIATNLDPGGFWLWQLTEEGVPPTSFPQSGGLIAPTGLPGVSQGGYALDFSSSIEAPDYLAFGGGGIVTESNIFYSDTGEALLEARGLGWGHLLDQCPHHTYFETIGIADTKNDANKAAFGNNLKTAIYNLFAWNSEVSEEVAESRLPSQIGRLLMRPIITDNAIDAAWDSMEVGDIVRIQPGNHSVLDTMQRLAARFGWWMFGNQTGFWIDSIAAKPVGSWHRGVHFSSFNVKRLAPPATGYVSTQRDAKWNGRQLRDSNGNLQGTTDTDDDGEADRSVIVVRYRPGSADIQKRTIVRDFGFTPLTEQEALSLADFRSTATLTTITETEDLYLQQFGFSEITVPSAAPNWDKYITQTEINSMEDGDAKDAEQAYYDNVQTPNDISRDETIAIMTQALARRSLADMNIVQMDCEMINGAYGADYGNQWRLGSTVIVYEPGRDPQLMIVGQVAIRVAGTKDASIRAGLGHTDNLAPGSRHTFVFSRPWLVSTQQTG